MADEISMRPVIRNGTAPLSERDWGLLSAVTALVLDQATKLLMLYGFNFRAMAPGSSVDVLPFFNLVMVWNPGVSYGLFPARGPWGTAFLALFSITAILGLGWWLWNARRRPLALGLGLVIVFVGIVVLAGAGGSRAPGAAARNTHGRARLRGSCGPVGTGAANGSRDSRGCSPWP